MVRLTSKDDAKAMREEAVLNLAKIGTGSWEVPPDAPTEEEIQRHTDMCVENWTRILGAELAGVERLANSYGVTLRATAELFVREWFNQKVRVI